MDYTAEWHELISQLCGRWLVPCTKANAWIARVESNGHKVENLADFQRCSEAVQDWIERNEWHELAQSARNASSSEESLDWFGRTDSRP